MSVFDPNAGFTGTPDVTRWAASQDAIAAARMAAKVNPDAGPQIVGASLDLWPEEGGIFVDGLSGQPQLYENIEDLATVTRTSKSWSDSWTGANGDPAGPLIEHASGKASWAPSGLTVSPSVENLIPNSRGEGGALPSTPTGWALDNTTGLTIAFVARGVADGWPYVDLSVNGTAGSVPVVYFSFDVTASPAESITTHIGVAVVSGSVSAGAILGLVSPGVADIATVPVSPDAVHRRWAAKGTAPAGTTGAWPRLYWPPGTVFSNAVIRIFAPQLTKTAYAARPVLPPVGTPGAATRASETVSVPLANWYRHDQGTAVIEFSRSPLPNSARGIFGFHDDTFWGRLLQWGASGNTIKAVVSVQGGPTTNDAALTTAAGRNIFALRWAGAAHRSALNGILTSGFTASGVPVQPDGLLLGYSGPSDATPSSTPIHRFRFFPRALSDAEMALVTTPYWST